MDNSGLINLESRKHLFLGTLVHLSAFESPLSVQNFYKTELNKEEMYIRYIHKLYDLHLKAQNFTGNGTRGWKNDALRGKWGGCWKEKRMIAAWWACCS